MARALFFILLLLNLLVLAGLAGLLGERAAPRGEAERLTNQLRPDSIRLLSAEELAAARDLPAVEPPPAPPVVAEPVPEPPPPVAPPEPPRPAPVAAVPDAPPVPRACVRFTALDDERHGALVAMAREASDALSLSDSTELVPSSWWVHVPPLGSRRDADRKVTEIRARGVNDLFILQEEGPFQYAISLGLFKTEASAQLHLQRLEAKGVTSGVITARGSVLHTLEMRGPADVLTTLASETAARFDKLERAPCSP